VSFRYDAGINKPGFNPLTNGNGIWNLSSQANAKAAGTWPRLPGAPTIGTATAGDASASVTFTAPIDPGVPATITSYTVTSSPGGFTGTGSASPITVSGLTNGTAYTFTVTATNVAGTGPASAASNSVTPALQLQLFSWGKDDNGQLGLGNTTYYSSPKQVGSLNTWAYISNGVNHALALKSNGTLWSWGKNQRGQLGLGNTTYYSSPKQVGALTNWLNISAGQYASFAIKTDNTIWAWGYNFNGGLGTGNTTQYSSPKQIGSLTNWLQVSGGYNFTGAVKTDGTLWMWGLGANGQLGLGNTTYYSSPKQVGSLTGWAKVSCGQDFTTAVKTDGTLWSWGQGTFGRLGLGNVTNYSSPKQIGSLTNWSITSSGLNSPYTLSVKTDGTLWGWGANSSGELGLGDTTVRSSPAQVGALTNWLSASAVSGGSMIAVKTNGTLWTSGNNNEGQLGLGNTTGYSSPKQVGSLTTWKRISSNAGVRFAMALRTA
jgi:alpha-tubulin suppressor-like RCC1 family protein